MASLEGVRRAAAVEGRENVGGGPLQRAAEASDLDERGRDTAGHGVAHGLHQLFALLPTGFAVGGDDALVDAPARFDLDMPFAREQGLETGVLRVSEESCAGIQGAPDPEERVRRAPRWPRVSCKPVGPTLASKFGQ